MAEIIPWAYFAVSVCLSIYGVNALLITLIYLYRRIFNKTHNHLIPVPAIDWPAVTIQLSVYNESVLVSRLIDSAARMEYPADRLTIQVLDDSTDDTTRKAMERIEFWKARGRKISLIHRAVRTEYKAGALRNGMEQDAGEFLALFDADFNPPPDWLKQALVPFFAPGGEKVGMVQTRWTHANEAQSPLTRAESIMLDGTFGIEHPVRSDEGLFFNFNGTAGIWRRRCIAEAGGWSGGTLSEDLDLSYRAQLKGWTFRYLVDVTAPAELPTTVSAYKIQQYRWAKGSMQVVRVQAPRVLRAPVGPWKKLHGLLHMSGFLVHLMIVLIVLLSLPLALAGTQALQGIPVAWLGIGAVGGPFIIGVAAWSLYPKRAWWKRVAWMPVSLMLGTGVAVSNSIAVITGLLNVHSPFHRTPKPGDDANGGPQSRPVRLRILEDMTTWLEVGLAAYAALAVDLNIRMGMWAQAFYLSIFAAGFAWVALATRVEAVSTWLRRNQSSEILDARMD